jgi:hypothetical protein
MTDKWGGGTTYGDKNCIDVARHNPDQDKPARYMAAMQAFLAGRPLPEQPYTNSQPPQDYEGPR